MSKPLVLAGFMATGKSTVGQLCAARLGLRFVDTDQEIERRSGMPVARLFETQGEALFRRMEADLAREIGGWSNTVVATGGGMLVDDDNRRALRTSAICVALTAGTRVIAERLGPEAADGRPMLRGGPLEERVSALMAARRAAYADLHYTIDTGPRTPEEVAERVLAIYGDEHERITVNHPGGAYDIVTGQGILDHLGHALAGRFGRSPASVVSDSDVAPLYVERVVESLRAAGMSASTYVMPAGEAHKTLREVERMYSAFAGHGLERGSAVLAVGGGVVGDAVGFAAATYLRGVPFVQVPTSMLAMADSSIGGKVGVDTDFGKNLVGAFKQPELVWMDFDTLGTLPDDELRNGMAEVIKAAIIRGGLAWRAFAHGAPATDDERTSVLRDAILLKREIVQEDPFEHGRRALLNLGHTFGHGIETWSGYRLKHGFAVSLGMACAMHLSRAMGMCADATHDEVLAALGRLGLPTRLSDVRGFGAMLDADQDRIWALMQSDKKKQLGRLRFVVVREPGDVVVRDDVDEALARAALRSIG